MGIKEIVDGKESKGKDSIEKGISIIQGSDKELERQRKIREEVEKAKYYEKLSFIGN